MYLCHDCKKSLELSGSIGRTDTCPLCDADLHCCLNCRFYDPGAYNQCSEPQAERVLDKDKGNFCDYFSFKAVPDINDTVISTAQKKANPLDALFKK
jgi:hypothetical protein